MHFYCILTQCDCQEAVRTKQSVQELKCFYHSWGRFFDILWVRCFVWHLSIFSSTSFPCLCLIVISNCFGFSVYSHQVGMSLIFQLCYIYSLCIFYSSFIHIPLIFHLFSNYSLFQIHSSSINIPFLYFSSSIFHLSSIHFTNIFY